MRTTKETKQSIQKYVLDCINSENYGIETNTDKEKLQFLVDTFTNEYAYPQNIKRYGTIQNTFVEWMKGLPSSFNIDFENYRLIELGKEWNFINDKSSEKEIDKYMERYWSGIYMALVALLRKHSIEIKTQ